MRIIDSPFAPRVKVATDKTASWPTLVYAGSGDLDNGITTWSCKGNLGKASRVLPIEKKLKFELISSDDQNHGQLLEYLFDNVS